ncbi:four-helix bundle copper-binding protein [Oceanobacillus picturae]
MGIVFKTERNVTNDHEHCQKCAEACFKCAEACKSIA